MTERVRDGQVVDVGDVQNPDFQYELIEDYLGRNHIVDEKTLLKIKDINDELNSDLPDDDVNRNIFWKIKRFEWSNMFSYGESNVIDFTKLNGIIGMFHQRVVNHLCWIHIILFIRYLFTSYQSW